ncbi:MAG TPA: PKD domain-containing protein [Methanomicrobiales archaeon]|nr:PKD domain-containing protein [Methanomicrobiales archaeon]
MGNPETGAVVILALLLALPFLLGPASGDNTLSIHGRINSGTVPMADFSASPTSGTSPLTVKFTDASTGTVTAWSWEYRMGGAPWKQFATIKDPSFTFRSAGTYDIRLTVSGPGGSDAEVKPGYITVEEPPRPPIARFTQDRYAGMAPVTVHFTDRSLYNPGTYLWQFGDGRYSTEKSPSHTYSRPGIYQIRFRVSNSAGSDTAVGFVVVLPGWWR